MQLNRKARLIFLFLLVAACFIHTDMKGQQVIQGRAHYQGEEELKLSGEWEIHWDTLFVDGGVSSGKYIDVPGNWTDLDLPIRGYATYQMILVADQDYPQLGALVPETNYASQLYINGKLVSSSGKVDSIPENNRPKWAQEFTGIQLQKGENILIWQISNFEHRKSGTNKAIIIGDFYSLLEHREIGIFVNVFIIGSWYTLGLFLLSLHLYWRKDRSTLYLALMLISYGIRFGVYDLHLFNKLFTEIPWLVLVKVEYITMYSTFIFFVLFKSSLYPEEYDKKILKAIIGYLSVNIVIVLILPMCIFSRIHQFSLVVFLLALIYSLYVTFRAYRNKKISGYLTFAIISSILLAPLLSILLYLRLIDFIPFLEYIGALMVGLTFSFVIAVRYANLFQKVETLQLKTQEQNEIIQESLNEKEMLLAEIHHRVKNNLQTINSLLLLQSNTISDPAAIRAIQESQYRIQTMALVHQKLYQTKDRSLGVDVHTYFLDLTRTIVDSLEVDAKVKIKQEIDSFVLDLDTVIHIGLIVNELIVNSIKYAFEPNTESPSIFISLNENKEGLLLVVEDNGKGMTKGTDKNKGSFGLKLVDSLSRKLKAKPIFESSSKGTKISFVIKNYKIVK